MKQKFLRRTSNRYSKLGKRRKKKQVWRRPTGRDNKMRERRKGYPARVEVGYRKPQKDKKEIARVDSMKDLEKMKKGSVAVLGKFGKKKKLGLARKAKERGVEFSNIEKFLKSVEKKEKGKSAESKDSENKDKNNKKRTDKTHARGDHKLNKSKILSRQEKQMGENKNESR